MGKIDPAIGYVRQQSARCSDHYVGSHKKSFFLLIPAGTVSASVDYSGRDRHKIGKAFELHVDLLGQFPGRNHDYCSDMIVCIAFAQQAV